MTDYTKMLEEISPDGNIEISGNEGQAWGERFDLSIDQAPVDVGDIFPEAETMSHMDTGVDENFSNCTILLARGEHEDLTYFVVGWASAGEYSDEDFEGSFGGQMFVVKSDSEENIEAAEKCAQKQYNILAQSEVRKRAQDIVTMCKQMEGEAVGVLLESDEFLQMQRLFARAA